MRTRPSAGATSGLETASTATAVNVDANNRQLHPVEAEIIGLLAKDYAQQKGISEVEARKRLTRGALYNIDAGWKQSIDTYLSDTPEKIAQYQEAYAYINAVKPTDMNANDWSGKLYDKLLSPIESIPQQPEYSQKEKDLIPVAYFEKITVTAKTDPKSIDEIYYLDTSNNSFTALPEDFNKQTLFMNKAYDDDDTAELYKQSAKMKYGEDIGLKEAALTTVTNTMVIKPLGAISGIDNAVDSNVELVKREWNKSGLEHFNDLVNVSKVVVGSGKEIISNPKQTLDNALDGAKQLKEEATTEWNYRKLKNQQGLPFDTSYKDAQMVGELATDAVMVGGAGKAAKVGKKGLENLGRNLDNLTPSPAYATTSGTPDIRGGATAVTGKPKPDSGIGAAETGGAILAVSNAPDGSYTRGPDGSMTGPNKGRSTSTGKFDKNGEEIYQRDSGGYYIVDENGIQRSVKSPYTNNRNITQKDNKYDWIDNERHPDPNVTSGFATTKPTPSSNQYFKTEAEWQAPGRGTGLNYKVYQQEIDLNARPFKADGDMRTNAQLMAKGDAPYILKNGQYEQVQLHHSHQDGRGSLFEVSKSTHLNHTNQDGRLALHPYKGKHPDYPVERNLFKKDKETYWQDRLHQLQGD
ncbi:HNH/ENDO VII family nuclease [Psychrobacter phenylpyruvicus]|uniref:LHH domain-containing protein n=1 Tax=Psychrobacter phenylpyruvicus TaxID=29432 RepID=A0A379LJ75_9GAMM|nr:HNH/ENDO VII family nuclease [Psychrobacter phenylpyruvicus]SUD90598.1 Uncharacterised protein [Psychrobacter phenylpyruvicus]